MDDSLQTTSLGYAVPSVEQRNRVLRNTYWLLALSMVPTVLGAWLGVSTGIVADTLGGSGATGAILDRPRSCGAAAVGQASARQRADRGA